MSFKKSTIIATFVFIIGAVILTACQEIPTREGTSSTKGITSSLDDLPISAPTQFQSSSQKRLALVIGNSSYGGGNYLTNPVNDAKALAGVLRELDFEVIHKDNLNRKAFKSAVRQFSKQLKENQGIGLFYFSGHGLQHQGINYLIPIGAEDSLKAVYDLQDETVTIDYVLKAMKVADNNTNILILDACRNPPRFVKSWYKGEVAAPGLASQKGTPGGSLIAYAAAPGAVALSGEGQDNSPYVKYLMKWMQVPNLSINDVLRNVRKDVKRESHQMQEPQYTVALDEPFYFRQDTREEQRQIEQASLARQQLARQKEEMQRQQANIQAEKNRLAREKAEIQREQARLEIEQERQTRQRIAPPPQPQQVAPRYSSNDSFSPGKVFRDRLQDGSKAPEMVWIPAGRFRMGDIQGGGDDDEKPVHSVSVNRFAMGRYEVTFAEYDKFAQATGRGKPSDSGWGRGNRPVINVSWNDATAYTEWLSQQTGEQYRLPTEAEWEYAARAGTETKYWWGNDVGSNKANCYGNDCGDSFEYTAPVGSFQPNRFGLYDTVGNVYEWTCSEYENKYKGKEKQCLGKNRANRRVLRGGSWYSYPSYSRAASRYRDDPVIRNYVVGLRLVRVARI
ncbi:SUMF1/EgtB/PvdO family nonheme iron enzyme [Candidatus Parabeggiatoa sp. HSG14]|uniref:SUMF1/EgtB/PvdO family nonheme iron enzyme n=1 Tax=Candidatus Parabeggiatoa sp. HSG14 TaxID=3055593 RepID=UPI0025A6C2FE|nr:SUMF1/EgtB/PvdO family nonheme iron enzyme [Thiotrichales bacterium HSG14]